MIDDRIFRERNGLSHLTRGRRGCASRGTGQRGFTLVELMAALTITSVGILGIAQVFMVADRHTMNARKETVSALLAQEIREKIMSETYDDIRTIFNGVDTRVSTSVPVPASEWASNVASRLGPGGYGTITVLTRAQDPTLIAGMLAITVTLAWKEQGRTVSLPVHFNLAKIGA